MIRRAVVAVAAALCLTACASPPISGAADDGERFTGESHQTGFFDLSGSVVLKGDRGTLCTGVWFYPGVVAGPSSRGTATLTCNDGQAGELVVIGQSSGTGEGYIGTRKITVRWGPG